jgi:hypothetical protein
MYTFTIWLGIVNLKFFFAFCSLPLLRLLAQFFFNKNHFN